MSNPVRPADNLPDPLQAIRDDLQRRTSEATSRADRDARRAQLTERLFARFEDLVSFAARLLAPEEHRGDDTFFVELARRLLTFNATLHEADREYPRYRIRDRLNRAAQAGVPALDTVATLLLLDPAADPAALSRDLERIQGSRPHDVWSMWLTYILDQLLNSHNPPAKDCVPPDTTRDEWRKAEVAFGCILFSDESFRVLQESMDQAACTIDAALKSGGHRVLNRPPGRVRDLIARFDPRALHWYCSKPPPLQLLQPPPSLEAITEPFSLRRQLDEVWTAAHCLQIALDNWAAWFVALQQNGDAHPGVALTYLELAQRAIQVLLTHGPNVEPFDRADEATLLAMLPPIPAWWMPGTDVELSTENNEPIAKPRVRWQEDKGFLDRYYWSPERRQEKAVKLRGAAAQLIDLLQSFPMTAFAPRRPPAKPEEPAHFVHQMEAPTTHVYAFSPGDLQHAPEPSSILDSLLCEAESRRRREDEAQQIAQECARQLDEHATYRDRLARAFDHAYAFPHEEREQGRKPSLDGSQRWAERFVALGTVMRQCDEAIENLRLRERLRTVVGKTAPGAMTYACALLLVVSEGKPDAVASALEKANDDRKLRRFVLWLPFILDSLWPPILPGDGPTRVHEPPDGTSREEKELAEQAFGWRPVGSLADPPPWVSVDRILDQVGRRQQVLAQLGQIEYRLEAKKARVVEALHSFASTIPIKEAYGQDQVISPDHQEALADALLQVCQAIRDGGFDRGMELILSRDREDAVGNDRLAIDLYRRGWRGDRQGIVDLVCQLDRLPAQRDNFDPAAPSRPGVWEAVLSKFKVIIPWPPGPTIHPWHPDLAEAGRLQAELSPRPTQGSVDVPTPNWPWPLVGERTMRRDPVPDLAKGENRERQSRYCQGFDSDSWLPALLAAKWRTPWYPREATRESVKQWVQMIDQMLVEYQGPLGIPERAAELEAGRENDLALIRECAPHLLEFGSACHPTPTDSPPHRPVENSAATAITQQSVEVLAPTPLPAAPNAVHNADFTMVNWFGTEYHFALGIQSSAVRALWKEWERSRLGLHQETIRNEIDGERDSFRMDTVFRNHPAFGTMLQRCGDGRYKLAPPGPEPIRPAPKPKRNAKSAPKSRQKRG
jgi:hypothetical protein